MVFGDFGFNFDDMLRSYGNPKSSKKLKHSAYNPIIDGIDLTGVMREPSYKKPFKKGRQFPKQQNTFFDGLDLRGTMDFGGINLGKISGNEMLDGNFFKYINKGYGGDIRGVGKESKKSKARRGVRYSESMELYGIESLENAISDSYDAQKGRVMQVKENFRSGPTKAKAFYKRKIDRELAVPRAIKQKISEFGTRRKIKKSLEPDFDTGMGSDKSKEISETYGQVRPDPAYELPERRYDFDDRYKEKFK